jgi:hypothetical protein
VQNETHENTRTSERIDDELRFAAGNGGSHHHELLINQSGRELSLGQEGRSIAINFVMRKSFV